MNYESPHPRVGSPRLHRRRGKHPHARPVRHKLNSFIDHLIVSEVYDDANGYYHFGDGTKCGICANGATKVARAFGGVVWGHSLEDNTTAALERGICFGHDFAIVRDRWLVDYCG